MEAEAERAGEREGVLEEKRRNEKEPTADLYIWTHVPDPRLILSRETSPSTGLVTCESWGSCNIFMDLLFQHNCKNVNVAMEI